MRIRRKTKRRIKRFFLLTPVMGLGWLLYMVVRSPASASPSAIPVSRGPDEIEKGRYLFTAVAACDGCHSSRDFTRIDGPVIPGGRGAGRILEDRGLPGRIVAGNLTPDMETGLGSWTDGEKIRAIREGVGKDGRALYPLMPYTYYRKMSDEDVHAIVAFLDSMPPVRNALPKSEVQFWTRVFMNGEPQPVTVTVPPVDPGGGEIYGEYLTTIAACEECHTPLRRGSKDLSRLYAGGRFFDTPYGEVYSANITSDRTDGIGSWTYTQFEARLRHHRQWPSSGPPPTGRDRFTVMPWESYAKLADPEVEAIYLYIKAVRPLSGRVFPHPGSLRGPDAFYTPPKLDDPQPPAVQTPGKPLTGVVQH